MKPSVKYPLIALFVICVGIGAIRQRSYINAIESNMRELQSHIQQLQTQRAQDNQAGNANWQAQINFNKQVESRLQKLGTNVSRINQKLKKH